MAVQGDMKALPPYLLPSPRVILGDLGQHFFLIILAFSLVIQDYGGALFSPFPVCRPNGLSGSTPLEVEVSSR